MEVQVYAIYDSKAQAYLQPFFSPNNAMAFRNCQSACMNPSSPFVAFPGDFTLFNLGVFDDVSGVIDCFKHAKNLGSMIQFLPAPAADTKVA